MELVLRNPVDLPNVEGESVYDDVIGQSLSYLERTYFDRTKIPTDHDVRFDKVLTLITPTLSGLASSPGTPTASKWLPSCSSGLRFLSFITFRRRRSSTVSISTRSLHPRPCSKHGHGGRLLNQLNAQLVLIQEGIGARPTSRLTPNGMIPVRFRFRRGKQKSSCGRRSLESSFRSG